MDVCIVSYKTYWGECRRMLLPSLANILHTLKGAQLPLIDVPRASPQSPPPISATRLPSWCGWKMHKTHQSYYKSTQRVVPSLVNMVVGTALSSQKFAEIGKMLSQIERENVTPQQLRDLHTYK